MAPSGRRRAGRTLRRTRCISNVDGSNSTRFISSNEPLQAIGENAVVDRAADDALDVAKSLRLGLPYTTQATFKARKKRKERLETLLDELETQGADDTYEKCDEVVADAERRAQELMMELKVQLLFLPEAVRQLPWKTFVEDFDGDFQNAIHGLSQSQKSMQASPLLSRSSVNRYDIVAATPSSVDDHDISERQDEAFLRDHDTWKRRMSAFLTPMDQRRIGKVPSTVLRTARKGETIFSARGSPIVSSTVANAKAPVGSLIATFEKGLEPTSCCIQLDSERVLDLSRPEKLSAKSRGEATSKLKALQAKVAQILLQINPSSVQSGTSAAKYTHTESRQLG
ncbi:Cell division protein borealin [Plasmopara halstedii]|uniref:Cell division protein borealin n=1 Tax=Plasmopara halstedii TaxID=4781 RepID=A0A0P1AMR2_PLAHL|nr:Cell division protein borealin [Plasmopara halstedii]CEG42248.1 Cell division protein borealin [Plasmopara halstedii]|eukprot:XP_024578617.1 Cell division protein borealin [Plasmopara halstedii]